MKATPSFAIYMAFIPPFCFYLDVRHASVYVTKSKEEEGPNFFDHYGHRGEKRDHFKEVCGALKRSKSFANGKLSSWWRITNVARGRRASSAVLLCFYYSASFRSIASFTGGQGFHFERQSFTSNFFESSTLSIRFSSFGFGSDSSKISILHSSKQRR